MNYSDARRHIRDGDLIAFSGQKFLARWIRRFTGAAHSHVGVAVWAGHGGEQRLWLVESREGRGVTMRLLSGAAPFDWLSLTPQMGAAAHKFIWPRIGTGQYDWRGIFKRIFGIKLGRDDLFICSEFAGETLARCDMMIDETDMADPGRLVEWALRNGAEIKRVSR